MSVIFILLVILLFLMVVIGENRGTKSFVILLLNFGTFFGMLKIMAYGLDPIKVTIVACIIISSITLFFINGINKKTVASLLSVFIVVLLTVLLTYKTGNDARLQGFSNEGPVSVSNLSYYINTNFSKLFICEILIGLLGAIIDVAISIASSMYEMQLNNPAISKTSLFRSGMNIGRDILGTMANTMLFAYISGFMAVIVWLGLSHYPVVSIFNSKIFGPEIFQTLCAGIGIILVIPVTAAITTFILFAKPAVNPINHNSQEKA